VFPEGFTKEEGGSFTRSLKRDQTAGSTGTRYSRCGMVLGLQGAYEAWRKIFERQMLSSRRRRTYSLAAGAQGMNTRIQDGYNLVLQYSGHLVPPLIYTTAQRDPNDGCRKPPTSFVSRCKLSAQYGSSAPVMITLYFQIRGRRKSDS